MNAALALVEHEPEQIPNPVVPYVEAHPGSVLLNVKVRERFLAEIGAEIKAFVPDLSTKKSRDEIASLAYKVARTKAPIEKAAKALNEDFQKRVKAVNAEKNDVIEALDDLRDLARKPLDEWETMEAARDAKIKDTLDLLDRALVVLATDDSRAISNRINRIECEVPDNADFFERKATVLNSLRATFARVAQEEKDRAELAQLRAAENERKRVEDERLAAETHAKQEAERIAREEKAAQERIEAAARRAAEEAEARAKRDADAEAAKVKAAADAEIARLNAAKDELERAEMFRIAEQRRLADEELARQKDTANRTSVMTAAKEAIMRCGTDEEAAKKIVKAIVAGKIANVSIRF